MSESQPIRLFKSDFMEFFSRIHPGAILVIWIPVIGFFGFLSFRLAPAGVNHFGYLALFAGGLFIWTFAEYILHRFVFHFHAKTERLKRISFLFHGVHHAEPMEKTRLVMPPPVSVPLGGIFFGIFFLVFGVFIGRPHLLYPMFTGFALGYLLYDLTHYSLHHFNIKGGYLKAVRKNHMRHHAAEPDKRFGVTSNLWDYAFKTMPPAPEKT